MSGKDHTLDDWRRRGRPLAEVEHDRNAPIRLLAKTSDTVTLLRADFDSLLEDLEDAEDRIAVLEHHLATAQGDKTPSLTTAETERLLAGESPVKIWRQKLGLTQRQLAASASISQSQVAEIEARRKDGSIDTLRMIAGALQVSLDALVPVTRPTLRGRTMSASTSVVELLIAWRAAIESGDGRRIREATHQLNKYVNKGPAPDPHPSVVMPTIADLKAAGLHP